MEELRKKALESMKRNQNLDIGGVPISMPSVAKDKEDGEISDEESKSNAQKLLKSEKLKQTRIVDLSLSGNSPIMRRREIYVKDQEEGELIDLNDDDSFDVLLKKYKIEQKDEKKKKKYRKGERKSKQRGKKKIEKESLETLKKESSKEEKMKDYLNEREKNEKTLGRENGTEKENGKEEEMIYIVTNLSVMNQDIEMTERETNNAIETND